jgi:hypothetical protein
VLGCKEKERKKKEKTPTVKKNYTKIAGFFFCFFFCEPVGERGLGCELKRPHPIGGEFRVLGGGGRAGRRLCRSGHLGGCQHQLVQQRRRKRMGE